MIMMILLSQTMPCLKNQPGYWYDYCNEMDCLMMESVGLQYNESFGTATKLLTSDSLITISIVPMSKLDA